MNGGDFLRDKGAKRELSAMRLTMFVGVGVVLAVWAIISIKTWSVQSLPDSVVTLLGLLVGSKAIQRFGER